MRRTIRARSLACLVASSAACWTLLAGCGGASPDGLKRHAVSGTVRWDGEPLKAGMIQFQPTSPGEGTAGGAAIGEGAYAVARAEGLVAGSYRVSITTASALTQPVGALPGDSPPPSKEPIPPKYNSQSTLTAAVKEGGPNKFDFDLRSR